MSKLSQTIKQLREDGWSLADLDSLAALLDAAEAWDNVMQAVRRYEQPGGTFVHLGDDVLKAAKQYRSKKK